SEYSRRGVDRGHESGEKKPNEAEQADSQKDAPKELDQFFEHAENFTKKEKTSQLGGPLLDYRE
ncbi:MAG: hypothetical protein AB1649_17880, partial [Chloroflexota bacterium]